MKMTIYIKNQKKPVIIISRKSMQDELYEMLRTKDIIKIGPVIFRREDFVYASEEETK